MEECEKWLVCSHSCYGKQKKKDDWTKKEIEKVQHSLKSKTIITNAHSLDAFLRVSHNETSK